MHLFITLLIFSCQIYKLTQGYLNEELKYINTNLDPCDDFYEYVCGNFKKEHPLVEDTLTIDQYTLLQDKLTLLANKILSSREKPEDPQALKKAKWAYQACTDLHNVNKMVAPEVSVVIEQDGFPLVQPQFEKKEFKKLFGWHEIGKAVGDYGIPMIFNVQAYSDPSNHTNNLIYISQTTLTLPPQLRSSELSYEQLINKGFAETVDDSQLGLAKGDTVLKPFDVFLRKMAFKLRDGLFSRVSDEEVVENIEVMTNFMRGVFLGGYVPENTHIRNFTGQTVTLRELNEWTIEHFGQTAEIDWVDYLNQITAASSVKVDGDTVVLVYDGLPKLIYGILNWVRMNEAATVKNFVLMRIFLMLAPDGDLHSRGIVEEYLRGLKVQILPRWKYCTRKLMDATGTAAFNFALAYEYQLRHFDADNLGKAIEMIQDIKDTFRDSLKSSSWMDQQCRDEAVEKFDRMVTILGYPSFVTDPVSIDSFYEKLRVYQWDNYGNAKRISSFRNAYQISQLARRDRTFWDKSVFDVNAYYSRPNNKITFPVSMLNPVFFGSNNSILDYGRIGSVIGHEMTHGFDKDGKNYDSDGIKQQWWTQRTQDAFENKTNCFIDQYNKFYVPELDAYVDGRTTLNENIADNGGVRQSYRAMKKMLARTPANNHTGDFTAEQLFFIGFGTMWCNNPSVAFLSGMKNDEHAVNKWRVNGVTSNMEEFGLAFGCSLGSRMNPRDKCQLW